MKSDKNFFYLPFRGKELKLSKTKETKLLIKKISTSKLNFNINEKLTPVLKILVGMGYVDFELIDSKRKKILAVDFYPKIYTKAPVKWEISNKCYFLKEKDFFTLRTTHSVNEIKFYSMFVFENLIKINPELNSIIYHILSKHKFLKTGKENVTWDFHDDLFHEMSRSENLYLPKKLAVPARKKKLETISLLNTRGLISPRKSRRVHSSKALSFKKISILLKSVAVKKKKKHLFFGDHYEGVHPSAGGTYENEFYLLVNNCEKLKMGLYHYDGLKHELKNLSIGDENAIGMLKMAAFRINQRKVLPQAVIIVTSKIHLLQKKYSKVAYRLSLLNAGVVTAYLDLLSNQLQLAGCPTGSTDWRIFEEVTGIDHVKETAMMEFVIGESEFFNSDRLDEKEKY